MKGSYTIIYENAKICDFDTLCFDASNENIIEVLKTIKFIQIDSVKKYRIIFRNCSLLNKNDFYNLFRNSELKEIIRKLFV